MQPKPPPTPANAPATPPALASATTSSTTAEALAARAMGADPPPWAISVGFWLNNASRRLLRRHDARLRQLGFTMSQLPVLLALEEHHTLSQKELARVARVEQPTMAEALARMERDGVVERTPNPDDKRGSLVSLSRRARARLGDAKEALANGEADATAGLSADEKATLMRLLTRVAHNLADDVEAETR